jgi:hypothetical protein
MSYKRKRDLRNVDHFGTCAGLLLLSHIRTNYLASELYCLQDSTRKHVIYLLVTCIFGIDLISQVNGREW